MIDLIVIPFLRDDKFGRFGADFEEIKYMIYRYFFSNNFGSNYEQSWDAITKHSKIKEKCGVIDPFLD